MNRLLTTNASLSAKQPLIANMGTGSIPFIQDGVQEALWNLFLGMYGTYTTNDVVILEGFIVTLSTTTTTNDTATWTAGRVAYNGEIYTVAASVAPLVKTSGVFLYSIKTVFSSTLDPFYFSDNNPYSAHQIRQITITSGTSGSGVADYGASTVKPTSISTNTITAISGIRTDAGAFLKTLIIAIGDWNMSSSTSVSVLHGIANWTKIRNVTAMIINDASGSITALNNSEATATYGPTNFSSQIIANSTQVVLRRADGGFFTAGLYNNTGFNRGWITIQYDAS